MKLLLISANMLRLPDPVPPLGAAYVAGAAREQGHDVRIHDLNIGKDWQGLLTQAFRESKPEVVGISLRNVDNTAFPAGDCYLESYREVVRVCREAMPDVPVILGGSAFSLFPEDFLKELGADFGIVGEGERAFPELLNRIAAASDWRSLPRLIRPQTAISDLDSLIPARDLLDVGYYFREGGSINIQTKRGCAYRCSFCTYPLLEGRTVRMRHPTRVVDEMQQCLSEFGTDYFFFVDSVFTHPESHARAICEEIIRRGLKVRWTAYAAPDIQQADTLPLMRKSGCEALDFGTDAASPGSLAAMEKSFGKEDIVRVSRWCREAGISLNHSLILGVPGETRESAEETIACMESVSPTSITLAIGVRVYPGTSMADRLIKSGWCTAETLGIQPVFYVEEALREWLVDRARELYKGDPRWIVPGLVIGMNQRYFSRLRSRGIKGPLWTLFDAPLSSFSR